MGDYDDTYLLFARLSANIRDGFGVGMGCMDGLSPFTFKDIFRLDLAECMAVSEWMMGFWHFCYRGHWSILCVGYRYINAL